MNENEAKDPQMSEFSEKLIAGINKALRKLVEETAANDGELVISDGKGHPRSVPAKELLEELKKNDQKLGK